MRTQLYSHNKTAYQKVMKAFDASDRTCVVHPTGTGKSYLIAAVSESYNKVLILGPNIFVLDQARNVLSWRKDIEYMTYTMLMYTENPQTDYDLIVLDEFHRAGAQEWGAAVTQLLDANKQAKVFGTSATPIRYLDNERNMAEELFHGNVASQMSVGEVWSRNILPIPTYITGLFDFHHTIADAERRVTESTKISQDEKRKRLNRLSNLSLEWEQSHGMPSILQRHLDKDIRRVIVFCANIEKLESMRETAVGWFRMAGFTIAASCTMHKQMSDKQLRDAMNEFESDEGDGVRLMFSVNMLNEGVHIPRVGAVLMLRTTSSRIIFLQQMGRCLTAANTERPVILDMVDNITTTTGISGLAEDFDEWTDFLREEMPDYEPKRFDVVDYKQTIRQVLDKLSPQELSKLTVGDRIEMLRAFCEEHQRAPKSKDGEIYRHFVFLRVYHGDNPEVKELLDKYYISRETYEIRKNRLRDWLNENKRVPEFIDGDPYKDWRIVMAMRKTANDAEADEWYHTYAKNIRDEEYQRQSLTDYIYRNGKLPYYKTERRLYSWLKKFADSLKDDPFIGPLLENRVRERTTEEKREELMNFLREKGRVPTSTNSDDAYEQRIYYYYKRMRKQLMEEDEEFAAIINGFEEAKRRMILDKVRMVSDFIKENGRAPSSSIDADEDELKLVKTVGRLKQYHSDMLEVKEMLEDIQNIREGNSCVAKVLEFEKRNGRLPRNSRKASIEERSLANSIKYVIKYHADESAVKELFARYPDGNNRLSDCIGRVRLFYQKHNRLPHITRDASPEEKKAYTSLNYLRNNYPDHPLVVEMMSEGGYAWGGWCKKGVPHSDIDAKLAEVEQFAKEKGYMPSEASTDKDEVSIAYVWRNIMRTYPDNPKVVELKSRYHKRTRTVKVIREISEYADKIGRLPRFSKKDKTENKIAHRLWHLRKDHPNDPELKELLEKYQ